MELEILPPLELGLFGEFVLTGFLQMGLQDQHEVLEQEHNPLTIFRELGLFGEFVLSLMIDDCRLTIFAEYLLF